MKTECFRLLSTPPSPYLQLKSASTTDELKAIHTQVQQGVSTAINLVCPSLQLLANIVS